MRSQLLSTSVCKEGPFVSSGKYATFIRGAGLIQDTGATLEIIDCLLFLRLMTVSMFACCLRLAHSAVVVAVSAPPSPLISIQHYGTGWWFTVPKYFLHLSGERRRRMQPFEHLLGLCWYEIFKKNSSSSSYLWFSDSWALQCFIQSPEMEDKWSMHISSHLFINT